MILNFREEPFGYYALRGYRKYLLDITQNLSTRYLSQRLGFALRKLVLQNKLQVIDGETFGIKARFYPLDNLADRLFLFMPKIFETEEFIFLKKNLQPDSVFIDIGANSGFYSLVAATVIDNTGKIIAFEPNPIMINRFKMNIGINGRSEVIELVPIGLADRETEFDLALDLKNLGGSTISPTNRTEKIKIKCIPLLNALQDKVDHIDFLKIDIEGADIMVMKEFFNTAPPTLFPKYVIIESDEGLDMKSYGYEALAHTKAHNTIYAIVEK